MKKYKFLVKINDGFYKKRVSFVLLFAVHRVSLEKKFCWAELLK